MRKRGFLSRKIATVLLAAGVAFSGCTVPALATSSTQAAAVTSAPAATDVQSNSVSGWPQSAGISSVAGCLMDVNSGAVLFNKNMDQKMYPASTTKIMTALIALEHGNMDDTVTMTQTGVDYAVGGSSNLNTQVGEQFKLGDMMYAMMLKSANDIATQIGEYIGGGSLSHFVDMMNEKARELGCTGTHFHNACGMPDKEHYTTAHDLARIGMAAIQREDFRKIIGTVSYQIPATNMSPARTVQNHVAMFVSPEYKYDGVIGGKTGLTDDAGSCLVTFCERDGRLLVAVTLKGENGGTEVADQKVMYDYAFQNFENIRAGDESSVVSGGTLTVPKGVTLKDLKETETEGSDEENGKTLTKSYEYNGVYVGSVTEKEETAESTASADEVREAGSISGGSAAAGTGTNSTVRTVSLHSANTMQKVIIVLAALILLGVILIIVTAVRNRKHSNKRSGKRNK